MSGNVQFENDWHAPSQDMGPSSRMARWAMRKMGFKSEHGANIFLVIFAVCAFLSSLYLFFIY